MTHDYVSVRRQGRVAIVTFDRGNPLNALSFQAIEELTDVARSFEGDLEISAIVLTAPLGSGFSAGPGSRSRPSPSRRSNASRSVEGLRSHLHSTCASWGRARTCGRRRSRSASR